MLHRIYFAECNDCGQFSDSLNTVEDLHAHLESEGWIVGIGSTHICPIHAEDRRNTPGDPEPPEED